MTTPARGVTDLLVLWRQGDAEAQQRLMALDYDDLRRRAAGYLRRERAGHTLPPTALVHEAYLRLVEQDRVVWQNRAHFLAIAASMMRRVLMDHGRRQKARKRGGFGTRVTLDDAFSPSLRVASACWRWTRRSRSWRRSTSSRRASLMLRALGGLEVEETAEALGISPATVKRHWAFALAWLQRRLRAAGPAVE